MVPIIQSAAMGEGDKEEVPVRDISPQNLHDIIGVINRFLCTCIPHFFILFYFSKGKGEE